MTDNRPRIVPALLAATIMLPVASSLHAQASDAAATQAETRMTTAAAPVSAGKPILAQAGVAGTVDAKGDAGSVAMPQMTRDNGAPIGP